jgi:AcrR family transcriptional regulator
MNNKEQSIKQIILEAAETEFLEKGYGNAKNIAIAKQTDMNLSMSHYYFRRDEKYFLEIFNYKRFLLYLCSDKFVEQFCRYD